MLVVVVFDKEVWFFVEIVKGFVDFGLMGVNILMEFGGVDVGVIVYLFVM